MRIDLIVSDQVYFFYRSIGVMTNRTAEETITDMLVKFSEVLLRPGDDEEKLLRSFDLYYYHDQCSDLSLCVLSGAFLCDIRNTRRSHEPPIGRIFAADGRIISRVEERKELESAL